MRGLLTSLAVEGLTTLQRETAAAAAEHDDPVDRLTAVGLADVRVGQDYPAHMEVVFRPDLVETDRADMQQCGMAAFSVVESAVQAIADEPNPALEAALGRPVQSTSELVERFTEMIVNGIT
jgi:hypothetical protein